MSFCADCFKAVTHDGTPEGETRRFFFLTDACGLELVNNKLLTDDYARNGFKTIAIDLFNGDPVPVEALNPGVLSFLICVRDAPDSFFFLLQAPPFDWPNWLPRHGPAQTRPLLDVVIAALKTEGVADIAASGYCFGGMPCVLSWSDSNMPKIPRRLLQHATHLTWRLTVLLKLPSWHIQTYRNKATAPLLINGCTFDPVFPPEDQEKADTILGSGNFAPGYKREYWEGCSHGFAVKGDLADEKVKEAKEGAFKATMEWLFKYM
ncbi:Protein AIM2 [Mycena venus]|uniref:Protein AIM2 n=1 Tax=Mycena venus TaxID=2733690 RepID=A0A8H6XJ82_9AGAR|nr:Protein AIM2 [Mycena venus]